MRCRQLCIEVHNVQYAVGDNLWDYTSGINFKILLITSIIFGKIDLLYLDIHNQKSPNGSPNFPTLVSRVKKFKNSIIMGRDLIFINPFNSPTKNKNDSSWEFRAQNILICLKPMAKTNYSKSNKWILNYIINLIMFNFIKFYGGFENARVFMLGGFYKLRNVLKWGDKKIHTSWIVIKEYSSLTQGFSLTSFMENHSTRFGCFS